MVLHVIADGASAFVTARNIHVIEVMSAITGISRLDNQIVPLICITIHSIRTALKDFARVLDSIGSTRTGRIGAYAPAWREERQAQHAAPSQADTRGYHHGAAATRLRSEQSAR